MFDLCLFFSSCMCSRPLEETTEEQPPETGPADVTPVQPAVPPTGEGDLIGDLLSLDLPGESSYNAPAAATTGGLENHCEFPSLA